MKPVPDRIAFYFDEMMRGRLAQELIQRGYTVVMANDVGMIGKDDDSEHLSYAAKHGLVTVTLDKPFANRTSEHTNHTALICWTPEFQNIGRMLAALSQFADEHTPEEVAGRVFWLK